MVAPRFRASGGHDGRMGTLQIGTVDVRPVTADDFAVVERLWQLYSHDLSDVRGTAPNADGLFKTGRLPSYFDDPDRSAHLIANDGFPIGFVFLTGLVEEPRTIGEFFVVRAARRKRIGFDVATDLVRRFPGRWEIGFQAEQRGAPELWRGVAAAVAGDAWREVLRPVPGKPHIPHDHFVCFEI